MPKESLGTRVALVEKELEMRKEIIELEFKNVHDKLDGIDTYLKNGLSKDIARYIKNGYSSDKIFLGMKPETRAKLIGWGIRGAILILAGKEGYSLLGQ
jgi:hypothetical protein